MKLIIFYHNYANPVNGSASLGQGISPVKTLSALPFNAKMEEISIHKGESHKNV